MSWASDLFAYWQAQFQSGLSRVNAQQTYTDGLTRFTGDYQAVVWGQPIPLTFGMVKINAPIIQLGKLKRTLVGKAESTYYSKSSTSFSTSVTVAYAATPLTKMTCDIVLALGYSIPGKEKFINKIWRNGYLIYDRSSTSLTQQKFSFFKMDETHTADPRLTEVYGHQPAYRGLMTLMLYDYVIYDQTGLDFYSAQNYSASHPNMYAIPTFQVEMIDYVQQPTPKVYYTVPTGYTSTATNDSLYYDSWNHQVYTFTGNYKDTTVQRWDVDGTTLLASFKASGYDEFDGTGPIDTIMGPGNAYHGFDRGCLVKGLTNQSVFALGRVNLDNNSIVGLMNMNTFKFIDHFGHEAPSGIIRNNSVTGNWVNVPDKMIPFYTGQSGNRCSYVFVVTGFGPDSSFYPPGYFIFRVASEAAGEDGVLKGIVASTGYDYYSDLMAGGYGATNEVGDTTFIVARNNHGTQTLEMMTVTQDGRFSFTPMTGYTPVYDITSLWITADGGVVIFEQDNTGGRILKYDPINFKTLWVKTGVPMPGTSGLAAWRQSQTAGGMQLGWVSGTYPYQVAVRMLLVSGDWMQFPLSVQVIGQPAYDAGDDKFYGVDTTKVAQIDVAPSTTIQIPLSEVLRGLCISAGIPEDKIYISGIDDYVNGAIEAASFSLKSVLNDLAAVYKFSILERDGGIALVRSRTDGTSGTVFDVYSEDRVDVEADGNMHVTINSTRITSQKVPSKITLNYIDYENNYATAQVTYTRPDLTNSSDSSATYSIPIIMSGAAAATLAQRMTYAGFEAQTEHVLRLSQKFLTIDPGDIVKIHRDDYIDIARVTEVSKNGDWTVDVKAEGIGSVDFPTIDVSPLVQLPPERVLGDGTTLLYILDIPAQSQNDLTASAAPQYYAMVKGSRGVWPGGSVYRNDISTNSAFQSVGASTTESTTGLVLDALPDTNYFGIDRINTIRITPLTGNAALFSSTTTANMLAGTNRILVGDVGRWELIGYETVTTNSDKSITLSGILRGLGGTDCMVGTHTTFDKFVFVEGNSLVGDRIPLAILDKDITYAACGGNLNPQHVAQYINNYSANGRRPLAPINPKATLTAGDLVLSWTRRARFGTTLVSGASTDPDLDETTEQYTVEIYKPDGTKLRTITGITSPTTTYTAAMMATDGYTISDTIHYRVWQVSSVVGDGFPRDAEVPIG